MMKRAVIRPKTRGCFIVLFEHTTSGVRITWRILRSVCGGGGRCLGSWRSWPRAGDDGGDRRGLGGFCVFGCGGRGRWETARLGGLEIVGFLGERIEREGAFVAAVVEGAGELEARKAAVLVPSLVVALYVWLCDGKKNATHGIVRECAVKKADFRDFFEKVVHVCAWERERERLLGSPDPVAMEFVAPSEELLFIPKRPCHRRDGEITLVVDLCSDGVCKAAFDAPNVRELLEGELRGLLEKV